jgi:Rhamnan synthesis protein F
MKLLIELTLRLPDLVNPSLYISTLRIRAVVKGQLHFSTGNYAIFAIRPSAAIPDFIYDTLEVLAKLQFAVIIVSNRRLSKNDELAIQSKTHLFMRRNGRGRDFGGFKDAIHYLMTTELPNSLLLLNDSVYYIPRLLPNALNELTRSTGFAAFTDVYEVHYHAQANCLFFSRSAISHPSFRRFWQNYLPISTRSYAIHRGEVRLSRTMLEAGFSPQIIFDRSRLIDALQSLPFAELIDLWRFFPNEMVDNIREALATIEKERFDANQAILRAEMSAPTAGLSRAEHFRIVEVHYGSLARREIFDAVNRLMDDRNTLHVCGLLLTKYAKLPVMKRDMVYRNIYRESILEDFARHNTPELLESIREDNRLKGNSKYFGLIKRFLYNCNII